MRRRTFAAGAWFVWSMIMTATAQSTVDISSTAYPGNSWLNRADATNLIQQWKEEGLVLRIMLVQGSLACGFYGFGASYLFGVFILPNSSSNNPPQLVWSANRNNAVRENAMLQFTMDGELRLVDEQQILRWSKAFGKGQVTFLELQESGDLAIVSESTGVLWRSSDEPTNVLLDGHQLLVGRRLTSSTNPFLQGVSVLEMQREKLVLFKQDGLSVPLWSFSLTSPSNLSFTPYVLFTRGSLVLFGRSSSELAFTKNSSVKNSDGYISFPRISWQDHKSMLSFLRLEDDGSLRMYKLQGPDNTWHSISLFNEKKKAVKVINMLLLGLLMPLVAIATISTAILVYRYRKKKGRYVQDAYLEMSSNGLSILERFSYKRLYEATQHFSKKLGQGGFGSVFFGTLPDGSQVAVKRLESVNQGQKEFRTEVNIIGSIHHVNLVRLRGFCAEQHHRLLVYEYMPNGSLDGWLFQKQDDCKKQLDWQVRLKIALGIARGLRYLHEDCNGKIAHLDVKPQNILLDEHFNAKVADFGLSRLMTAGESQVFTNMRGTRGYMAPEWLQSSITEKADVYSFGIVLLEIVSGQRCLSDGDSSEEASLSKFYFPAWASQRISRGKIMETVDKQLHAELQQGFVALWEQVEMLIYVALWCIQVDPARRPPMGAVVQMLEGVISVTKPPLIHDH